jgi:adenylate cyclase
MNADDLPRELREDLIVNGYTAQDFAVAATLDELDEIVWERIIRGDRSEFDLPKIAAVVGVETHQAREWLEASGLRVEADALYCRADITMLRVFQVCARTFGPELTLGVARLCGTHLAAIADGMSAVVGVTFEPLSAVDRIRARLAARSTVDAMEAFVPPLLRLHIIASRRLANLSLRRGEASHDTRMVAVGFVDLVGFTPTTAAIDLAALSSLVERFESRATKILASYDGRLVKFIGDAVMFITANCADAVAAALDMVEAFGAELTGVAPRGGIAAGAVLARGGDFFGPVVNLAARIADIAVPGEVLIAGSVRDALNTSAAECSPAGRRMLKGFAQPVELWAVSRCPIGPKELDVAEPAIRDHGLVGNEGVPNKPIQRTRKEDARR